MEEKKESHSKFKSKDFLKKCRDNPWIVSTIVLGIFVLIFLIGDLGLTGHNISENDAGQIIVNLAGSQGFSVQVSDVQKTNGLYEVFYSSDQGDGIVYLTLDGKNLISSIVPLEQLSGSSDSDSQTTEVPKSDRPVVELFIWGYCPYGVQAQGPLAEVANLLGDYADFETILYYDGHGAHETQQNEIQACIQKLAPEKYWDYASGFVENIYPKCGATKDVDCDKTESVNLMNSLGIDSNAVLSCVDSEGENLVNAYAQYAQQIGVTGSPTLVINGVIVQPSSRTAEAFKSAVCDAFNNAPEVCGVQLENTSAATSSDVQC